MTVFDDWFEQVGSPSLFGQFSESVTLIPVNGDSPFDIVAIVSRRSNQAGEQQTHDTVEEFEIEIKKSDYFPLKVGDKIQIDDERQVVFGGRVVDESNYSVIAIFSRKLRNAQGRGR